MANEEHLAILKQGVDVWNEWRKKNSEIMPDLRGANFHEAQLAKANLKKAELRWANFRWANLREADLREADLREVNFSGSILDGAKVENAVVGETIFVDVDLSSVKGLEKMCHWAPSSIGIDTIYESGGKIPEEFLRDCGMPDNMIEYMHSLAGQPQAFDYYSAFISYSCKDDEFAKRIHNDLHAKNVRVWFAPDDMKIGDEMRPAIDEAIHMHDKLIVVLSENSINSAWVEKEVETAFEKERQQKRIVLFPIRLDDAVMVTDKAWAADIRRMRHIGDFSDWENQDAYQKAFDHLLRDLKANDAKIEDTKS